MSKRMLAASAALMLMAASQAGASQAGTWTGFYVGLQGGLSIKQMKFYDGTSHTPGKTTHTVGAGKSVTYDMDKGLQAYTTKEHTVTLTCTSSALAGNDDYAVTEWIYRLRPAGNLLVGYNYRISGLFVVGVEARAGVTFGAHKYDGLTKAGVVTMYGTESDTNGIYKIKTETEKEDPYYANLNKFSTQVEVKTNFSADVALRFGFVLPGDRFGIFVRGGVGVDRQEMKYSRSGFGAYLYEAALQAGNADAKVKLKNATKAMAAANNGTYGSGHITHDTANDVVVYTYLRDSYYFGWILNDALEAPNYVSTLPADEAKADEGTSKEMAYKIADWVATNSHGLCDSLLDKAKQWDPSLSESKSVFTAHVGVDFEYKVMKNLLLRLAYEWKWCDSFWLEQRAPELFALNNIEIGNTMKSAPAKAFITKYVKGARGSDKLIYTTDDEVSKTVSDIMGHLSTYWSSGPAKGSSVGTANHKFKVKNSNHLISLALIYKF